MLKPSSVKLAGSTILHVLASRVASYDNDSSALELDGAGHRAVFALADYLAGHDEGAPDYMVEVIAELAHELPLPTTGAAFAEQLARRAKAGM